MQKEMYTFTDRSDRSLTLRPEGTAPICRAYLTHGLQQEPQPQKLYTIGPMYRYGRPGKGRYREHWQLSVEALGSDDPALDAEVIHLYDTLLRNLGVSDYTLELNSIGDRNCRPAYVAKLSAWLGARKHELDDDTRDQAGDEPAARARQHRREACARPGGAARGAGDRGLALRRLHRSFRGSPRAPRRARGRVHARADPRPRAGLLHPHDVGVHRAARRSELDHLRRRPLRRADRGDRRPADAGRRLRGGDRAPAAGPRGRRTSPPTRRGPTSSSRSSRVGRARSPCAG